MAFTVTELMNDPDLCITSSDGKPLMIQRSQGAFVAGGYETTVTNIPVVGVVTLAEPETLEQIPEGDRVAGMLEFNTAVRIYQTNEDSNQVSDILLWGGIPYKVLQVFPWRDFGFFKAVLARMPGQ